MKDYSVKDLVKMYLKEDGYKGLYNHIGKCSCSADSICDSISADCLVNVDTILDESYTHSNYTVNISDTKSEPASDSSISDLDKAIKLILETGLKMIGIKEEKEND